MKKILTKLKTSVSKINKTQAISIIAIIIAVIALVVAGVLYKKNNDLQNDPKTLQKAQAEEAKSLKAKVAALINVPADETPTIATVQDKEKLKSQPFFADAENGDKILIFTQSKKAVIYREKTNRLINVGPIAVTSDKGATKSVKILKFKNSDGTKTALGKISGITISGEENAKGKSYNKPLVYDVGGGDTELAQQIASAIGGEVVTSLPAGESEPTGVDILVVATK